MKLKNFIIIILTAALLCLGGLYLKVLNEQAELESSLSEMTAQFQSLSRTAEEIVAQANANNELYDYITGASEAAEMSEEPAEENVFSQEMDADASSQAEAFGPMPAAASPSPTASPSDSEANLSPSSGESSALTNTGLELLQVQAEQKIQNLNAADGQWALYIEDLSSPSSFSVQDQQMQAASLIKLFIMGSVYENYDILVQNNGAEAIDSALTSMITVSDNDAANTLVSFLGSGDTGVGMAMVNDFCTRMGYSNTHMGRLLLDWNASDDNYTSVSDCGHFLSSVYKNDGTLSHAEDMYNLLKAQERTNKIPEGIPSADGAQCANKTGELDTVENDAAIIYNAPSTDYIMCIMSQGLSDTASARVHIAELSREIYGFFNE